MKNLESLNLQELSFEEQVNTDGGFWGPWMAGLRIGMISFGGADARFNKDLMA